MGVMSIIHSLGDYAEHVHWREEWGSLQAILKVCLPYIVHKVLMLMSVLETNLRRKNHEFLTRYHTNIENEKKDTCVFFLNS